MARFNNTLHKREVLYGGRTPPERLNMIAEEFLAEERLSDALDFFEQADNRAGLAKIKRIAMENGDTFLLHRLEKFDPASVTKDDWQRIGETAMRLGKSSMAAFAAKKLEDAQPKTAPGEEPVA